MNFLFTVFQKKIFPVTIAVLIGRFLLSSGCLKTAFETKTPKAPSNLSISVTSRWLTLTWQDNSNDETYFYIQRKSENGSWETKYYVEPNNTTFKENVLWTVPNPSFRIYAYNKYGKSSYSNEVSWNTYSSAYLWAYLCPDLFSGCSPTYFVLNGQCRETTGSAVPGNWYNTGFTITSNMNYALQSCSGCVTGCGSAVAINAPKAFYKSNYYPAIYFYCNTPCTTPEPPE